MRSFFEDDKRRPGDTLGDLACMGFADDIVLPGHDQHGATDGGKLIEGMARFGKQKGDQPAAVDGLVGPCRSNIAIFGGVVVYWTL